MSFRFFVSYARRDSDSFLTQFLADLENEVAGILGVSADAVSFVDTRDVEAGDEWESTLAVALRTCRLCVSICSQGYINSRYCGKEYHVFCDRRDAWLREHPGDRARVIFPVVWQPPIGELPECITRYQYADDTLPELYAKEGLRYLIRLNRHRDEYLDFVGRFAQRLVNAGNATPIPDLATLSRLSVVPSAFHAPQPAAPAPLRRMTAGAANNAHFVFVVARRSEVQVLRNFLDSYHDNLSWFWRPYYLNPP